MLSTEKVKMRIEEDLDELEAYRQANNLSKRRMGDKIGVTPQTYHHWQSGRNTPETESWLKIQHFLGKGDRGI